MRERLVNRYSECFKRQVIEELERGRFDSILAAQRHYGIGGDATLRRWLKRYGKNALMAKVVRVESVDEVDRLSSLREELARLQRALGQTQAENVLNQEYLKLACEQLGQEVEGFKKKCAGKPCVNRPVEGS